MCVSASGIWVRWSAIFIQSIARKTSIHLETKRVFSWFEAKQKLCISLIKSSPTLSLLQCLVCQLICHNKCWYNIVIRQQYSLWYLLSLEILMPQELFCVTVSFQSWVQLKYFSMTCLSKVSECGCGEEWRVCLYTTNIKKLFRPCQPRKAFSANTLFHNINQVLTQSSQTSSSNLIPSHTVWWANAIKCCQAQCRPYLPPLKKKLQLVLRCH